ncbi:gamma-glutamylcyclotransferase family protein [Leptothoe sp. PORK10 BA2]|uniref:gamma-glutamylcyclotransferase family protein n=1 Tax=Leptothoe sp. PORK10 BA2 TaxID=3110254 RepID=UPI002B20B179|nr:gamma-glutamylcyclotransferase family protein [Leptothoe sp. PORK10 BA2]MEA5466435.1 gamma-glutamylcyclotransferase family protein [Leptothoe sp. PORK10 BA2]
MVNTISMGNTDVFVYGTLKPGGIYHQQYCLPYLKKSQPAQVRGLLYDLPTLGYPAMTLGEGWVKGYLFTLDEAAMPGLDYLEGYNPHGEENVPRDDDFEEEYIRLRTTVFDLAEQPMGEAWVYVMAQPPEGAVFLPEGTWILP